MTSADGTGWGQPTPEGDEGATRPQPRYGQYAPTPPGQPQYGQPQDGQPQYGQPQYGQPQYGQPQYGQPQYGQPQYGQPQYGQPQYGQPQYGQVPPGYGPPSGFLGPPPSQRPGIIPLHPLRLGEVFDGAFDAIRTNPRVMVGTTALVVAITVILGIVLQQLVTNAFPQIFGTGLADLLGEGASDAELEEMLTLSGTLMSGVILTPLMMLVVTPVMSGMLTVSVSRSVLGHKATVGEVWAATRPLVWRLIGLSLLLGLAASIITAGAVGLVALAASQVATGGDGWVAVFGLAIIVMLIVIVILGWFAVRTMLMAPCLVLEKLTIRRAIARGWSLTRGGFWRLLGIYLLAQIAVSFVAQIVAFPISFLGSLALVSLPPETAMTATFALTSLVSYIVTISFLSALIALIYIDVRMRREGLDVELAAAAARETA